jgi:hypothetical protein
MSDAPSICPACLAGPKDISHDGADGGPGHIEFLCGACWHAGAGWYHTCEAAMDLLIGMRDDNPLIDSAPELLAALMAINEWVATDAGYQALPFEPPWAAQMYAAIAKATGKD